MRFLLAVLLLAACTAPDTSAPPNPFGAARTGLDALQPPPRTEPQGMLTARAVLDPVASCRLLYGPTNCTLPGTSAPFLQNDPGQPGPQLGIPWKLFGWTAATPWADTSFAWLIVGWQQLNPIVDFSDQGAPGCWLIASIDGVVALPVGVNDGLVQRDPAAPGRIELTWTPNETAVGRTVIFQLVVATDLNALKLAISPAMRATVGTSSIVHPW